MTELAELHSNTIPDTLHWFVLYVRPRYEKKVHAHCLKTGVETFLPLKEEFRQWSDRKKLVELPVFSGYLFVHVNERRRLLALDSDGAIRYVGFGGKLAVIQDETIESLKIALRRPETLRIEEDYLKPGTKVVLVNGPFTGMRGVLIERRGGTRIMVVIEAIAKAVSVEVAIADVRVISEQ